MTNDSSKFRKIVYNKNMPPVIIPYTYNDIPLDFIITSKLKTLFFVVLFTILFIGVGFVNLANFKKDYDLFKNGIVTNGVITAVEERQVRAGPRKKPHFKATHVYTILYDGHVEKIFEEREFSKNAVVEVYYSKKNSKNMILKGDKHPHISFLSLLYNSLYWIVIVIESILLFLLVKVFRQLLKKPRKIEDI